MDKYESLRSLPFQAVAGLLEIDLTRFKRRRNDWQGYCPVHQGKNNGCFGYNDSGIFSCFSCNIKGRGVIDLVKLVKSCNFTEAVTLLESTPLLTTPTGAVNADSGTEETSGELKPFRGSYDKFFKDNDWLKKRGYGVHERYGVGWYHNPSRKSAFNGRVMLPIKGLDGLLYGYLGRAITEEEPKYLFAKGFPKHKFLWGAWELLQLHPDGVKFVYLLESPFAVMKFASLGIPAVSPFGWSVSVEQVQLLTLLAKGVVYLPDSNKREDALKHVASLAEKLWLRCPPLPEGISDPEQLDLQQIQSL